MTVALSFGQPQPLGDGRALRPARLIPRSSLSLAAACLVANGARERLMQLLACELETEVTPPVILAPAAGRALFAGAFVVRARGHGCDAFVVMRAADARRLVGTAFGEPERGPERALSPIERETLERIAGSLAALCAPLCGAVRAAGIESAERAELEAETYFEVRTAGRVAAAIGFALTRDPAESAGERLTLEDLEDVEIPCRIEFARGALDAGRFAALRECSTVALDTPLGAEGILFAGDLALRRGTCGAHSGRAAFVA